MTGEPRSGRRAKENGAEVRSGPRSVSLTSVACVTAATGLFSIFRGWASYGHAVSLVRETLSVAGPLALAFSVIVLLVPLAKLAVAAALFAGRGWARRAAIAVLAVDAVTLGGAAVRVHVVSALGFPSGLPHVGGTIVGASSLWPTYLVAALSIGSVLVLVRGARRSKLAGAG
jgi:hypothetical protein